jgi:hypothetical protein
MLGDVWVLVSVLLIAATHGRRHGCALHPACRVGAALQCRVALFSCLACRNLVQHAAPIGLQDVGLCNSAIAMLLLRWWLVVVLLLLLLLGGSKGG